MHAENRLTNAASIAVRVAWAANRMFVLAVVVGLLSSWVFSAPFADIVGRSIPGTDVPSAITGMRLLMLLGGFMAILSDRLFTALREMIASASVGDPFVAANSRRLARIGWCLLALQLCEIPGALIARFYPSMGSAAPSGDVSIAGWISVLMILVLVRIFAAGSAMREDLEGTV